jgi:DNA modification methylase
MELNITHHENCLSGMQKLPDASIDCIITSPPYWGLRDYGIPGQLGQEPAPEEYIRRLLNIFKEIHRILKPAGTCFVNIGDTYAGSGAGTSKHADIATYIRQSKQVYILPNGTAKAAALRKSARNKSLLMIPYRFAWLMVEQQGWRLRNIINWHKPNQMPCSVKDRFTVDFEPIFFFSKSTKYYFSQQFEPLQRQSVRRAKRGWNGKVMPAGSAAAGIRPMAVMGERFANPRGRNMRTTWPISTGGFKGAHFAVYPEKLAERMLLAGCPEGGVVLDPFMGSGTTAVAAIKNNRNFIGYELNPDYIAMQHARLASMARK